jgi:acylpyruvate hydrolase
MRLVTMRRPGGTRAGRIEGDEVVELDSPDVGTLLASGPDWAERAADASGAHHELDEVDLDPVVPNPSKIICLGLNYQSHIDETGAKRPAHPTYFAKFARALVGARDPIILPAVSDMVDWEVELALVVGAPARHVAESDVARHVAGVTVANDISVRDWQHRTTQLLAGKTFEGTTPVGPALVTLDELSGGWNDLTVRCEVDGTVMQEGHTSELLFTPEQIIADLTRILTLDPGDLVLTGTPSGVGRSRTPPVFLREGQIVRTVIDGVGELENRCVAEQGAPA